MLTCTDAQMPTSPSGLMVNRTASMQMLRCSSLQMSNGSMPKCLIAQMLKCANNAQTQK